MKLGLNHAFDHLGEWVWWKLYRKAWAKPSRWPNPQSLAILMNSHFILLASLNHAESFFNTLYPTKSPRIRVKTAYDDGNDKSIFMKSLKSFNLTPFNRKTKDPKLQLKFTLKESHKPVIRRNLHLKVTAKITPFVECTWSECWNSNLFSSQNAKPQCDTIMKHERETFSQKD